MSVAEPFPAPRILVGVFTAMSTMSASEMQRPTSVLKKRLGWRAGTIVWLALSSEKEAASTVVSLVPSRATRTMSSRPGS